MDIEGQQLCPCRGASRCKYMYQIEWKWILNGNYGVLNALLMKLGILSEPYVWLGQKDSAFGVYDRDDEYPEYNDEAW